MDQRLFPVTGSGSVDDLYFVINEDPHILENVDVFPFIHTPLHEAASTGNIDLAMELMFLKPSFAKKLNKDGFSPLHLAVKNNQVELARELVKFDPSLIRIHGRGGMTPLHLVVKSGDVVLLMEFLLVCSEGIRDANANGETAFHMAVIEDDCEVLKLLRGWMQRSRRSSAYSMENQVLNRCDREGNTALHLAAYKNNHKAVKQLLKCTSLNRNIQNKLGMTALDVLRAHGPRMNTKTEKLIEKAGGRISPPLLYIEKTIFLKKQLSFREYCSTELARYTSGMSDGTRNNLLVLIALVITVTYQTAVQPLDKNRVEKLNKRENISELIQLWGFNTTAFFSAILLTFILLPVGRTYTWWYISISVPIVISYAISVHMKYMVIPAVLPRLKFDDIYTAMLLLLFLILLLVLFIKWKRSIEKKKKKKNKKKKKVPQPNSELLQDHGLAV